MNPFYELMVGLLRLVDHTAEGYLHHGERALAR